LVKQIGTKKKAKMMLVQAFVLRDITEHYSHDIFLLGALGSLIVLAAAPIPITFLGLLMG
jgi:hypothetical protein